MVLAKTELALPKYAVATTIGEHKNKNWRTCEASQSPLAQLVRASGS